MATQNYNKYQFYFNFAHYSWEIFLVYDDGNGSWVKTTTGLTGSGNVNAGAAITNTTISTLIPADANFFFYVYVQGGADQLLTREGNGFGFGGDDPDYMAIFNCSAPADKLCSLYSYGNTLINNLGFVQHTN